MIVGTKWQHEGSSTMTQMITALRRSPSILGDSLGLAALAVILVAALSIPSV